MIRGSDSLRKDAGETRDLGKADHVDVLTYVQMPEDERHQQDTSRKCASVATTRTVEGDRPGDLSHVGNRPGWRCGWGARHKCKDAQISCEPSGARSVGSRRRTAIV